MVTSLSESGEPLYPNVQATWSRLLAHIPAEEDHENPGFIVAVQVSRKFLCLGWLSLSHTPLVLTGVQGTPEKQNSLDSYSGVM